MPKKKKDQRPVAGKLDENVHIKGAGTVQTEPIVDTLKSNYMPYAMSVILSRALPEIDGFKPSHRKLLYTMYNMKLLTGGFIKSANIVGRTMQLNPHGDAAIYDTMIRLSRGNESLLYPYVESKGNFGKAYSKNMMYAASRYTEAKLAPICRELFDDINKDTVDFVDNYDNTMKEPTLLPVTFPSILCNVTTGIAVGMASSIASFNLKEVCDTTIALIKNPAHVIADTLLAPDFVGGGYILYNKPELDKIYDTGRGSVRVRAKYTYDKKYNCIDVTEIPPTTTAEAIIDKIVELVKTNKVREISDIRDETDLTGLKITIDLKRGVHADDLMLRLYKMTPLEDSFSCNFNVLVDGKPKVYGVRELLMAWIDFRLECVRRRLTFMLNKKRDQLHLLKGLSKILLDIDKAIKIVRETKAEVDVVPNLMIGFGIDEIQAEYVAEIKLRNINKEYILKRVQETEDLQKEIADLEDTLQKPARIRKIIVGELEQVRKKYAVPRRTEILYGHEVEEYVEDDQPEDYPVTVFLSREGYFKKITPKSLRMSGEQKYKEGDGLRQQAETGNNAEIMFFTDRCQVYKTRVSEFGDSKASVLGDYLPGRLAMDEGERVIFMVLPGDYSGCLLFFYENGKAARVELSAYATVSNRRKLTGAYSDKSRLVAILPLTENRELALLSTEPRALIFHTSLLLPKATRSTQGVAVMTIKPKYHLERVVPVAETGITNPARYRTRTIPAAGALVKPEDSDEKQITLL